MRLLDIQAQKGSNAMKGIFSAWRDWQERRQILRDIRRRQGDDRERLRYTVKDQLTYALSALEHDDTRQAADIWATLLDNSPREARESPLALQVLLGLRRYDEAETMMVEGRTAHPRESYFAAGLARVAQARGDHKTAIEHCVSVRKQFPFVKEGYTLATESLISKHRLDEAEPLAQQAMKLFSDEVRGFLSYGRIAVERQDWIEALRRWKIVLDRFGHQIGYLGYAQALQHLGRPDEAEALILPLTVRYPTDPGFPIELARMAQTVGNISVAIERWEGVPRRFPLYFPGCVLAAEALEKLGAITQAEAVLREAVDHFPTEPRPLIELGSLLLRREDFAAAVDVWATLRQAFPDQQIGYDRGAEALLRAGRPDEAEAVREEQRRRFGT
jgi:predicted Zn-dependent protease